MAFQDRTAEFKAAVSAQLRVQKSTGGARVTPSAPVHHPRSAFSIRASAIAKDITDTTHLLQKLAMLAKRRPMLDDRPQEITELTLVVKSKVSQINDAIKALQQEAVNSKGGAGFMARPGNAQLQNHSKKVVFMLQDKLGEVTKGFSEVLDTRSKNIQATKSRADRYLTTSAQTAGPAASNNPLYRRSPTPLASNTPLHRCGGNEKDVGTVKHAERNADHPDLANPYLYHNEPEQGSGADVLALPEQDQQLVLLEEQQSTYLAQRSVAVDAIESTINELGSIFSQLSSMIAEQRDTVQRIDANTEDIAFNVQGAHRELLKYYSRVSSNRWLIIKSFGIVLIFFLLWVLIS